MGMKARKRLWRWVTRDARDDSDDAVEVWSGFKKPERVGINFYGYPTRSYWRAERGDSTMICAKEFKKLFGKLPPTDEATKIKFSAEWLD